MKLAIQIPCYNEEQDLRRTIEGIPASIPGIQSFDVVIVDDGSTDTTMRVAREMGIKHFVRFPENRGLARAFVEGINYCLQLGADVIVNMDADNQYPGSEIGKLIAPILAGRAEISIGDRQVSQLPHFSFLKKSLQKMGSWIVRTMSGTAVPDVVSGFRAYSREAAMRMNVVSSYSYTVETLIQAGRDRMSIISVPVKVNKTPRESRLIKNVPSYINRMAITIVRSYTMYQPLKVFSAVGAVLLFGGALLFARFLYFAIFLHESQGHVQSLIFASALVVTGFQALLMGMLSDVVAANRKLLEEALIRIKKLESK